MTAFSLNLSPILQLTDEQYEKLCQENPDLKLELTQHGELVIMPPTGGETGRRNSSINLELGLWNRQTQLGIVFDSSTEFKLPNGANRSPDAAWIRRDRWDALTTAQKESFPPICPDFVIELLSPSDNFKTVQAKMQEYLDNGIRLGWLIDPKSQRIEIYRQGKAVEMLESPSTLSGENVLVGFVLDLQVIW